MKTTKELAEKGNKYGREMALDYFKQHNIGRIIDLKNDVLSNQIDIFLSIQSHHAQAPLIAEIEGLNLTLSNANCNIDDLNKELNLKDKEIERLNKMNVWWENKSKYNESLNDNFRERIAQLEKENQQLVKGLIKLKSDMPNYKFKIFPAHAGTSTHKEIDLILRDSDGSGVAHEPTGINERKFESSQPSERKNMVFFKSKPENYEKEKSGLKCNTIRKIDLSDERFKIIPKKISIINSETGSYFTRDITDITDYDGYRIYSWR